MYQIWYLYHNLITFSLSSCAIMLFCSLFVLFVKKKSRIKCKSSQHSFRFLVYFRNLLLIDNLAVSMISISKALFQPNEHLLTFWQEKSKVLECKWIWCPKGTFGSLLFSKIGIWSDTISYWQFPPNLNSWDIIWQPLLESEL